MVVNKKELATARVQVEELERDAQMLRERLFATKDLIREYERAIANHIAEFPLGTRVRYNDKPFEISAVILSGDCVEYSGRQVRKDGSLGVERRLYSRWWASDKQSIVLDPQQPKE